MVVWRPGTGSWYGVWSGGGIVIQPWGLRGDEPVPGDYDGDRRADWAVWRGDKGQWYIILSSTGQIVVKSLGQAGDQPVPGDYNGDGITDLAVWRPGTGTWFISIDK
ncbi:MAG TPA: VCBS repeat-containing protein [Candidatus Limnocylindrales bacterium]|nr:VCBS repeat-containing protein [Candidatus Limnocylindrales bacterium]